MTLALSVKQAYVLKRRLESRDLTFKEMGREIGGVTPETARYIEGITFGRIVKEARRMGFGQEEIDDFIAIY